MAADIGRFRYLTECTAACQERNKDQAHREYRESPSPAAPRLIQTIEVIHISPAAWFDSIGSQFLCGISSPDSRWFHTRSGTLTL
jgi:hypothetical protein